MGEEKRSVSDRRMIGIAGVGLLFDSMDLGVLAFVMTAIAQSWHVSSGTIGLLGSINLFGMAIGAILAGLCADRYGRKNVFMVTLLVYSLCTGLSAAASSIGILFALRFIVGLGLGGELPVATTFALEASPVAVRARSVVFLESFWALGSLVSSIVAYFLIPPFGWQIGFLVGTLPALYVLVLRRGLPETPVYRRERIKLSMWRRAKALWTPFYRKRTVVLWILWFASNFAYYGMFLWLPTVMFIKGYTLVHSFQFVLIMTLAQFPGYLSAAYLVERWGRKKTLVTFMVISAFASLMFGFAQGEASLLIWGMILAFFNLGAWGATYAFSAEQYPSAIRGSGTGWSAGIGRIGGILAPSITGWLLASHVAFGWIFGMFFIVVLIAALIVWWFGKDVRTDDAYEVPRAS